MIQGRSDKSRLINAGNQTLNQGLPFLIKRGTIKFSPSAFVPIVRVRSLSSLAVQVSVDGHAICGFRLINKVVGASPILFCIPPQRR